jgi:twinkle protein
VNIPTFAQAVVNLGKRNTTDVYQYVTQRWKLCIIATIVVLRELSTKLNQMEGQNQMETNILEQWAETRALDPDQLSAMGVTARTENNGHQWIAIPYTEQGQVVNIKHKNITQKEFRQEKDGKKIFYNQDVIFDKSLADHPLIITEGEEDALSFICNGHPKAVSVPDGAPNQEIEDENSNKYSYLTKEILVALKSQPSVILAVDDDKNGKNLLHDLARRIGRGKCSYVEYPKGCKDINQAVVSYGKEAIKAVLERSKPMGQDGVYTLDNLPPVAEAQVFESGITEIDNHFKFRLTDFSITTGIPSMGKTTMFNHIISSVALKNDINVCFASLEQHPVLDHQRNLTDWYMGAVPNATKYDATLWINKRFSFIYPSDEQQMNDELDLNWFLKQAEFAVHRHNSKIVVLDPWNEIEHIPYSDQSLTEYVGMAIRKIKRFAKINNVHMAVIAHPTKQQKDKDGNFQMPTLYDVSDSAHWYNKADLGAIVHRDPLDGNTIFKVAKSRYHEIIGKPGQVKLQFHNKTKSFSPML